MPNAPVPPHQEDERDLELPPLDADDEHDSEPLVDDEDDVLLEDEPADPYDDGVATDLDVGDELEDAADPTAARAEGDDLDAAGLDVGALDEGLVGGEEEEGDDGEGGLARDDDDDLDAMDQDEDDGGAEGTDEPIEDEVDDAALPALDADDEGDFEDEALLAEAPIDDEAVGLPWEEERWLVCEGAGAVVPCSLVVAGDGRVVAADDGGLLIVEDGARASRRPLPSGVVPVALALGAGTTIVASSKGGVLVLGRPAEPTIVPAAWDRGRVTGLAVVHQRLWIAADGGLWTVALEEDAVPSAPRLAKSEGVRAIAAGGGALVALGVVEGSVAAMRFRSDDEPWSTSMLEGDLLEIARGETVLIAASGAHAIAIAGPRGACVSRDGGTRWSRFDLPGVRAIAFAGEGDDADLLAVLEGEADLGTWLVRVTEAGRATRLAELPAGESGDEPLGKKVALAWDASRETAWIASAAGLFALARRRKH